MKCGTCLWVGRIALAIAMPIVLLLSFLETVIFPTDKIGLFFVNGWAGCWPWSPKQVGYYPGMTLCPGQTVAMPTVTIQVPEGYEISDVKIVSSYPNLEVRNVEIVPPKERMN